MKKGLNFILILLCAGLIFPSCSYFSKPKKKKVVVNPRPPVYENAKSGSSSVRTSSPASSLIKQGIAKLEAEQFEQAEWKFEEAVNIDPDYGPSYYWLARSRYKLQGAEQALGLLEKARSLLQGSQIWVDRIQKFKDYLLSQ